MVTYGLEWDGEWDGWPQLVTHLFTNRGLLLGIIPVNGMVYLLALPHILADDCLRCPVVISGFRLPLKKNGVSLHFLQKPHSGAKKNGYNTSCSSSTCIHKFIFKHKLEDIWWCFIDVYGSKISRVLQENTHHLNLTIRNPKITMFTGKIYEYHDWSLTFGYCHYQYTSLSLFHC